MNLKRGKQMSDSLDNLEWDEASQGYIKRERTDLEQFPYGQKLKCECGLASLGYETGHSDWCPLANGG